MNNGYLVRKPAVAGMFYPADRETLAHDIRRMLENASAPRIAGNVTGLVAPHAGYMYSGLVAAAAYAVLEGTTYDTVIVISPSHRDPFSGVSIYHGDAYSTPLGTIPIDTALREKLTAESALLFASSTGHRAEHAVEVQLPFLQLVLDDFKLLPAVMGDQTLQTCEVFAAALSKHVDPDSCLVVASSDLSHYYPQSRARELDTVAARDIEAFDPYQFMADLAASRTEACGAGPIAAAMLACRELGADRARVIAQCTSGDVSGDTSAVVGYLSALFWKNGHRESNA